MDTNHIKSDIYFAIVPEWVIDAPISAQAVRLYSVLNRYANKDDATCFPAIKTIAKRMHTSDSTVKRALNELKDIKAVLVEARYNKATGEQTSNLYTVMHTPSFIYEPPQVVDDLVGSSHENYKSKPFKQSKFAEQYKALTEAISVPATKSEIGGYNKCAKELQEAGATYDDIINRVLVYRKEWTTMSVTPYAIVKHWSMLGELLQDTQPAEAPMCEGLDHKQIREFEDGFSYCARCKVEYPAKNAYIPSS